MFKKSQIQHALLKALVVTSIFTTLCTVNANAAMSLGKEDSLEELSLTWLDSPVDRPEKMIVTLSSLARIFNPPTASGPAVIGSGVDPTQVVSWNGRKNIPAASTAVKNASSNKSRIEALAQALDPVNLSWRIDPDSGALIVERESPLRSVENTNMNWRTDSRPMMPLASLKSNGATNYQPSSQQQLRQLQAQASNSQTNRFNNVNNFALSATVWDINTKDVTLAAAIERWAKIAGYTLKWDAEKHVLIDAPNQIQGSFEMAVNSVLASPGILQSEFPLEACFYPNNPPLVRITKLGDQKEQCR